MSTQRKVQSRMMKELNSCLVPCTRLSPFFSETYRHWSLGRRLKRCVFFFSSLSLIIVVVVFAKVANRVVNNTFSNYSQYQYLYFMKNVLPILLPMPAIKSISHTFTNTFSNTFHVQLWRLYSTVNMFVIRLTESFLICISWKLVINHLWSKTIVKLAFSGGYCMNAYDYLSAVCKNSIISKCLLFKREQSGVNIYPPRENRRSTAAFSGRPVFSFR